LVPGVLHNTPQAREVAVFVSSETQKPNHMLADVLAESLRAKSTNASSSLFRPEFLLDGLFDKAFGGSQEVLGRLELANAADVLLLGRQSVQYSKNDALEGVITAAMKLELSVVSVPTHCQIHSQAVTASGVGFREADARAQAEERLIKQIRGTGLNLLWKAVLRER
jgi:hypothetical protein